MITDDQLAELREEHAEHGLSDESALMALQTIEALLEAYHRACAEGTRLRRAAVIAHALLVEPGDTARKVREACARAQRLLKEGL